MRNRPASAGSVVAALAFLAGVSHVPALSAQPARRIHDDLRAQRPVLFKDSTSPRISRADDLGPLPATAELTDVTLHFRLSPAQQADLTALLKRQNDRTSRDYHNWLTPEQFADRYGLADGDLQRVAQWLQSRGLTVSEIARSKTWISVTGIAADFQNAFGTTLHRYTLNGQEHYANANPISVPSALSSVLSSVRGLNNFRPKPLNISQISRVQPRFTSSITGNHFLAPDDFATIYNVKPLYNSGITGSGQKIAVAGQTDLDLADVRAFRQAAGLPANDPQIVLTGKDPGTSTSDVGEANLDLEWAGAIAPQASIIFVNSTNAFVSAIYAIDNNLAPVVSLSYGTCEASFSSSDLNSLAAVFQQGNAQGITIVAAGGDTGAADCDTAPDANSPAPASATHGFAVDVPGSIPYVTGMGGTTLQEGSGTYWSGTNNGNNGSALSYIPETAWNDTALVSQLAGSGGGRSSVFTKPSWQVGSNVPNDGGRDTPDVSLASSPNYVGYLFCSAGSCVNGFRNTDSSLNVAGGSSVASPTFAAIVALLNQQTGSRHGNINPGLYSLASISTDAFHDITTGNNIVPCAAGSQDCPASGSFGFSAGPGYDQVTGLGSVNAYNLISEWGADFNIALSPTALTVNPRSSNTVAVQISKIANFAGTVSFTCIVAPALTNTTCSIPGTVAGAGTATLTVTNASPALTPPQLMKLPGVGLPLLLGTLLLVIVSLSVAKRQPHLGIAASTLTLVLLLAACDDGGSSGGSSVIQAQSIPSVTGLVTVTATSGVESHSAAVTVTVP